MIAMFIASRLTVRVDGLKVMFAGLVGIGWTMLVMSNWTADVPQTELMTILLIQGFSQGLVLNPMIVMGFSTLPAQLRPEAVSVQSLCRTMSFAAGISITTFTLYRNTQTMHADISMGVTPFLRILQGSGTLPRILDPETVRGAVVLDQMIDYQARTIAYNSTFRLMAFTVIPPLILLFLLRRRARMA
jgi:hypothetical protein